jgi:hypothetical protein
MDESTWIADGTPVDEPVTTETPVEVTEVAETPPVEASESVAVEATETPAEVVQAYIEGRMGEEPYQLPENVALPLKRGDEVEYVPVAELLKRGMMERDYRIKTDELGTQRRAFQTERERFDADRARMDARAKYVEEKEAEIRSALTDPKGAVAFEEHLRQYENNPMYRKHVDTALASRETEAERDALLADRDSHIVQEASQTAIGWVEELAGEFPNVDAGRVREQYGQLLQNGRAQLDRREVERLFKTEADYLERASSPLQKQLAELTAKVEALNASKAADQHNETTAHALNRAKTPRVATSSGAPVSTPKPVTKFGPNELHERNSEWVRAGRS